MLEQITLFNDNPEYDAFVAKFEPKKTTDDCYTPPIIFETVKNWACDEYGINPADIVRPFYPGGDYESFNYPEGCTVLDNPPFSILSEICEFYLNRNIKFFLFAPSLTAFAGKKVCMRMNHIICDANITYENGAVIRTAFVTNYGGDIVAQTAPDLTELIAEAERKNNQKKAVPRYAYPDHIVTAALLQRYSKYGIDMKIRRTDCELVFKMDAQKEAGKSIFGGALLLSDHMAAERAAAEATAERAAAERASAIVWELSAREQEIIKRLGSADQC